MNALEMAQRVKSAEQDLSIGVSKIVSDVLESLFNDTGLRIVGIDVPLLRVDTFDGAYPGFATGDCEIFVELPLT